MTRGVYDRFDRQPKPLASAWLLALILAALVGRLVFVALPVNSDTAMFVYAGKVVAEGGRPGVDLLDNKLPSVGLLMSVPYRLFGSHWAAYGVLGLTLSLMAMLFLYRATRDAWGRDAALAVAVAAALWLNFPPAVYGQLQLETIQVFFASVAAACTVRVLRTADWRDAALAGLCGGMAMWAKPTGGAVIAAAGLAIALAGVGGWRQRTLTLVWLALGTTLPILVCVWTIVATGMADALPETFRQLRAYAGESTLTAMDAAKPLIVLGLLGFPVLILGGVFRRHPRASAATRPDVLFVLLWLAAELAGVVTQRRMYAYHFLVLGPPATLCVGLLARRVRMTPMTMAFGPVIAATLLLSASAWLSSREPSRDDNVVAYVNAHAGADAAVWADDYPRLLVETGRRPGSSVPLVFLMANGDAAPDFFGRQLLADWAERRPEFVVFPTDPTRLAHLYRHHMADVAASPKRADAIARQLSLMEQFLQANYRVETDIGNVRVWRRGEAAGDSIAAGH